MDYCTTTFSSTYAAIYAQERLKGVVPVLTMPVLREISLGCGIALRFDPEYLPAVRECLASSDLRPEEYAFYVVTGRGASLRAVPLPAGGEAAEQRRRPDGLSEK